jgi:hypothetical protein
MFFVVQGGAASYALKDRFDFCCVCGMGFQPSGNEDGGLVCSCPEQSSNFSYNDIDLIFGMELSTGMQLTVSMYNLYL